MAVTSSVAETQIKHFRLRKRSASSSPTLQRKDPSVVQRQPFTGLTWSERHGTCVEAWACRAIWRSLKTCWSVEQEFLQYGRNVEYDAIWCSDAIRFTDEKEWEAIRSSPERNGFGIIFAAHLTSSFKYKCPIQAPFRAQRRASKCVNLQIKSFWHPLDNVLQGLPHPAEGWPIYIIQLDAWFNYRHGTQIPNLSIVSHKKKPSTFTIIQSTRNPECLCQN